MELSPIRMTTNLLLASLMNYNEALFTYWIGNNHDSKYDAEL
jgi:hypothetical protein